MDDFELIKGCITGSKKHWDEFVHTYSRLIYDSILRTIKSFGIKINDDIKDDLHNEIFVVFLADQGRILREFEGRDGCTLASYIRTISVHKTIDHLRRLRSIVSIDAEIETEEGERFQSFIQELSIEDDHSSLEKEDAERIVRLLLAELRDDERQFCHLYFIENKDPEALANILGISRDNVYVHKDRILGKLKKIAKDKKIC